MKSKFNLNFVIGIIVGILVVGGITVVVLNYFIHQDTLKTTPETTSLTSKELIEKLKKPESVGDLAALYTESKTPITGLNDINYTKPSSYMISEAGTDFVQYQQKDVAVTDNNETVMSNIDTFLANHNLKKTEASNATKSVYTVYDGEKTTCQLLALPKMNDRPASLNVSCVEKTVITNKYEAIDKLLALYENKNSGQLKPATVRTITVTEENKTLTTLDIYNTDNSAATLIFAAIDDTWEYIGQRPLSTGTTESNPTGINRTISSELAAKIADPKYEGFLSKYIK